MKPRLELDAVRAAFRFLERDHGMSCVAERYDEQAFGNIVIDYEKADLFFRVVRDRSQFFFEIGGSSPMALPESEVLRLAGADQDLGLLVAERWNSLALLAVIAERNLSRLLAALTTEQAKQLVEKKIAHEEKLRANVERHRKSNA